MYVCMYICMYGSTSIGFAFYVVLPFRHEILSNGIKGGFLHLQAKPAIAQLRHLANNDFMSVKDAACKALVALGTLDHVTGLCMLTC